MDMSNQLMMDIARSESQYRLPGMSSALSGKVIPEKVQETAKQFEAVFARQMLEPMFESLGSDGMFGGGHAEGIYRSFLVEEIGQQIADRGAFGIADAVAREMLSIQEANSQSKA